MAYRQHDQNSCCFISLAPALKEPTQVSAANETATRISSSLTYGILDRVMFSNAILTDKEIIIRDQHLHYKLEQ